MHEKIEFYSIDVLYPAVLLLQIVQWKLQWKRIAVETGVSAARRVAQAGPNVHLGALESR